jgi:uncharacterized protein YdaU (DUF1376 family)
MTAFPILPLFSDAFIADTGHLSAQETGAYLLLLMMAWRSPDCRLPDDDVKLARWARVDPRTWRHIKPVVMAFWSLDDGHFMQKRLCREFAFVSKRAEVAKQNGKASAKSKPSIESKHADVEGSTDLQSEASKSLKNKDPPPPSGGASGGARDPTPNPIPIPIKEEAAAAARAREVAIEISKRIAAQCDYPTEPGDADNVIGWFAEGFTEQFILATVKEVLGRKNPPRVASIKFFNTKTNGRGVFADERERQRQRTLPLCTPPTVIVENPDVRRTRATGWQGRRDDYFEALGELKDFNARNRGGTGG